MRLQRRLVLCVLGWSALLWWSACSPGGRAIAPPPDAARGEAVFPAPPPVRAEVGPLAVIRASPLDDKEVIKAVSVTFNQPFAPLGDPAALEALPAPLVLEPAVPGRLRWLGPSTVSFVPDEELSPSTRFTATVPAGARAAGGATLAQAHTWSFETRRPAVLDMSPSSYDRWVKPEATIVLQFNQPIAAQSVRERLEVRVNDALIEVEVVERPAGRADSPALNQERLEDRRVELRPRKPLPLDATVAVSLAEGVRGTQGPLPSTEPFAASFHTYAPLTVGEPRCWRQPCDVTGYVWLEFNNPLPPEALRAVKIQPPLKAGAQVEISGQGLYIHTGLAPDTKYTITLGAELKDAFGQRLGQRIERRFQTSDYAPALALDEPLAVIHADGPKTLQARFLNTPRATLRALRVDPAQLPAAWALYEGGRYPWQQAYLKNYNIYNDLIAQGASEAVSVGGARNALVDRALPLGPLLGKAQAGLYLLRAEATVADPRWITYERSDLALLQVTRLGLQAWYDYEGVQVWLTGLTDTAPVQGARVSLYSAQGEEFWVGETDAAGMAKAPGAITSEAPRPWFLVATQGEDAAFVRLSGESLGGGAWLYGYQSSGDEGLPTARRLTGHLFSERGIYRPGEEVFLKGIVRLEDKLGVHRLPEEVQEVQVQVTDSRGAVVHEGVAALTAHQTFSLSLKLAPNSPLGYFQVIATPRGLGRVRPEQLEAAFQVEAYRAPEFLVSASWSKEHHLAGERATAKITGRYLFGAPMRGAEGRALPTLEPSSYQPPGHEGFWFGEEGWGRASASLPTQALTLDQEGEASAAFALEPSQVQGAMTLRLDAEVIDANRQSVASSASAWVHPAEAYFGIKVEGYVFRAGEPIQIEAISAAIEGARGEHGGALRLERQRWTTRTETAQGIARTVWEPSWEEADRCTVQTRLASAATCALRARGGGYHRLVLRGKDAQGRAMETSRGLWVAGDDWVARQDEVALKLVLDKPERAAGETARLLITSPWPEARAMLIVSRLGYVRHIDLGIIGAARLVELPLTAADIPNLHLGVVAVRGVDPAKPAGQAPPRALFASEVLRVDPGPKRLQVKVSPQATTLRPGAQTSIQVDVTDAQGLPAGAEVTVAVVDEGVLSLIGYQTPDPAAVIWGLRASELALRDTRELLPDQRAEVALEGAVHNQPAQKEISAGVPSPEPAVQIQASKIVISGDNMRENKPAPPSDAPSDGKAREEGEAEPAARVRERFATTAYYMATHQTDAQGRVKVEVTLPDNLTTFRVMAVAVGKEDRFGAGQSAVTITQPLLLRAALPRFANVSDRFEANVVVNNETGQEGSLTVTMTPGGDAAPAPLGELTQTVTLGKGEARELSFPVETPRAGEASFAFAARFEGREGLRAQDGVLGRVQVQRPVTTESFAAYGETTGAVSQPLALPEGVFEDVGGLEVTLSSTLLTNLQDAMAYLIEYPYGCLEQTASRLLPLLVLKDLVVRFRIAGLDAVGMDRMIADGLERLSSLQSYSGGFRFWPGSATAHPYTTAWAVLVLGEARRRDHAVDGELMRRALDYLTEALRRGADPETGEPLDEVTRSLLGAVLALEEPARLEQGQALEPLLAKQGELPIFARALLAVAFSGVEGGGSKAEGLMVGIGDEAVEEASDVHFAEPARDNLAGYFDTDTRTDAIALWAYLRVRPEDPLVPKAARGLMEARVRGRWGNTQENAWSLLALSAYAARYEREVPDFLARLWVGEALAVERAFQGRQLEPAGASVSMKALREGGARELVVAKEGQGRLYYRLGLTWAPQALDLPMKEEGFTILRRYEVLEAGAAQPVEGAEVEVPAGAYVKVNLLMVVPTERHWVVVEDLLPAGLEPVNLGLKTALGSLRSQVSTRHTGGWGWGWEARFDHTEQRDDRVLLFADRLSPGVYEHSYVARATSPGSFYLPPAKIAEMYQPEVYGRTRAGRLTVRR
jgi:uncharacterized protein YfaS (alpha-2-macroglobulin family)